MKNKLLILMLLASSSTVFAATIHLMDGSKAEGTIVEQTSQAIRLETNGAIMTYFADEVKDIDGQPLGTSVKKAPVARIVQSPQPVKEAEEGIADSIHELTSTAVPESLSQTVSPEKRALILDFMTVFGTKDSLIKNFERMTAQAAQEKPELAQKIKDRIKADEIIEELVPVYDRNFSADELKSFIAFYGSSEGKKLISTMPALMKESVEASVRYMQRKFPELGK